MTIGEKIRLLREKAGYTQNSFSHWAGISQSQIRRIELDQSGVTVETLQVICDALGVTLKEFFDEGDATDELSREVAKLTPMQKGALLSFLKTL